MRFECCYGHIFHSEEKNPKCCPICNVEDVACIEWGEDEK